MAIAGQDGLLREVLAEAISEHREEAVNSIAELDSLLSLKAFQEFSFSAFEEVSRNMKEKAPIFSCALWRARMFFLALATNLAILEGIRRRRF